jgi:dihydrofolate reductase
VAGNPLRGRVAVDISISVDGFVTAAGVTPEEPLGQRGQRLHAWAADSADPQDAAVLAEVRRAGAMITGRRTYDSSLPWWGPDGPSGEQRIPLFVLTSEAPADSPPGGVYRFVTAGIESALAQARGVAGDREVQVMGGADVARQYLQAGLVDELHLHVVPVLVGAGTRLFDQLDGQWSDLEVLKVVPTAAATHVRYRVAGRRRRPA